MPGDYSNAVNIDIQSIVEYDEIEYAVTSIGDYAFYLCSALKSITIPESVTSIQRWSFASCEELTAITIPETVTSIGLGAFSMCSGLVSFTFPENVTRIEALVLSNCKLTSITIPESVTSIGEAAFWDCSRLKSIYIGAKTPPTIGYTTFSLVYREIPVFVPEGSLDSYVNHIYWGEFGNLREGDISTTIIEK